MERGCSRPIAAARCPCPGNTPGAQGQEQRQRRLNGDGDSSGAVTGHRAAGGAQWGPPRKEPMGAARAAREGNYHFIFMALPVQVPQAWTPNAVRSTPRQSDYGLVSHFQGPSPWLLKAQASTFAKVISVVCPSCTGSTASPCRGRTHSRSLQREDRQD